jgi:hypothetical protein
MIPLTSPIVMLIPFGVANCHFCKFAYLTFFSVVWFAAKYIVWEFCVWKETHGRITNGKYYLWNLKKKFLIIKIDMSKILIIEDEAAIRRVPKYFLREDTTKLKMLKTVCRVMKK